MTKVDITTAGHIVIVEASDPLDVVAAKALELWKATRDPALDRATGATGFIAERAGGVEYTSAHDATMRAGVRPRDDHDDNPYDLEAVHRSMKGVGL